MIRAASALPDDPQSTKGEAILDAAERCFLLYGYRKTSMEDVARQADVAKGTLYLYFAGKEALFLALLRRLGLQTLAACQRAAASDGPLEQRLYGVLEAYYGSFFSRYQGSNHLQELGELRTQLGKELTTALRQDFERILVSVLDQASAAAPAGAPAPAHDSVAWAQVLSAAAYGAKYTPEPAQELDAYRQRLRQLAATVATAF